MISIPPRSTRTYILFPYKTPCRSTRMFGVLAKRLFGSANDRFLKGLNSTVAATNALEPELQELSDEVLRARTAELRGRLDAGDRKSTRLHSQSLMRISYAVFSQKKKSYNHPNHVIIIILKK